MAATRWNSLKGFVMHLAGDCKDGKEANKFGLKWRLRVHETRDEKSEEDGEIQLLLVDTKAERQAEKLRKQMDFRRIEKELEERNILEKQAAMRAAQTE